MEVSGQNGFQYDEEKALNSLLDAFGSAFSLEEIASAYCKASQNADLAGEILSGMQRSSSTSTTNSFNANTSVKVCADSLDGFSFENSCHERENSRGSKPKVRPVSVGSVSSILGKDYARSMLSANGSYHGKTKPLKLDRNSLPMPEIWGDECKPNISKHDQLHQDMEDFLFKMLGDGFKLDREKIREVLDNCGYNMQKSMEKLMDDSILTLDKKACVLGDSSGRSTDMKTKSDLPSSERKTQNVNYPRGNISKFSNKGVNLHWQSKERDDLEKEVLASLFDYRKHYEESPKRIVKDVKKLSQYGRVVNQPPEDSLEEVKTNINYTRRGIMDEPEDKDEFENLRRAVKEYRATMNEYFKAAVDAFAKGDDVKAKKLYETGQFFMAKAHEADEESSKMIVETKAEESQEMLVDLRDHGSKEAISLLKSHLSLAGIPSFKYLKVLIGNQDVSKRSQRRRIRVMELLEETSIRWNEGETPGTIVIDLDNIDRKQLSFLKK